MIRRSFTIKRNLVKKVRTKESAQPEYQRIFSVETQLFLAAFDGFLAADRYEGERVCQPRQTPGEIILLHTNITICETAVGLQY